MALWVNDGLHEVEGRIEAFLLAGQSNMAGRGDLTAENAVSAPGCLMLRMGRWQPMSEPVNVDRAVLPGSSPRSGACLASSFAAACPREQGVRVGLVPCADGGTTITEWQPGGPLFDHAVMQAGLAMRTARLAGILWHQGESDCLAPEQLEAYPERFLRVMEGFRARLGEDVPIVVGELGYPENGFTGTPAELLLPRERLYRHPRRAAAGLQPPAAGPGRPAAPLRRGVGRGADLPRGRPALRHALPARIRPALSGRLAEPAVSLPFCAGRATIKRIGQGPV